MKNLLFLFAFLLTVLMASAQFQVADIFGDHMVLQRNQELVFWGWAGPKEKINLSVAGLEAKTKTDDSGRWEIRLPKQPAGGPYIVNITGKSGQASFSDVWIGEVWICSGQSNMEWPLSSVNNAEAEVAVANNPMIRMINITRKVAFEPQTHLPTGQQSWQACTPEVAASFSAVAYFMARKLQSELGVAIGLIGSNWGGTIVETWISPQSMAQDPDFQGFSMDDLQGSMKKKAEKTAADLRAFVNRFPDQGADMNGETGLWSVPGFNTTAWETMVLPGTWENKGIADYDGVMWFRTTFTLTEAEANSPITLQLGPIDDQDITWVNGQVIGKTTRYDQARVYTISPEHLHAGTNSLAIRVLDTGGGGGMAATPGVMKVICQSRDISLDGGWLFRPGNQDANPQTLSGIGPNDAPTLLYNGMIHPVVPYAIGGAIWYQGESNASRAYQYRRLFPLLIEDWREKWGYDFPFLWVQLANFMQAQPDPVESEWAELREAQSMTLSLPKTGQAVIIDIGDANDIHPRNKQDVGLRLALAAMHVAYGKDLVYSGPVYKGISVQKGSILVSFDQLGSGLMAKDKYGYLKGFTIAGADKQWQWAIAKIEGDKVRVWSDHVTNPIAVRYAWANNPDDANLYNKEGLPASPFRSDDWPGITSK
ncbi:MAG: beta galactosidase jelly roll domain-containing protein [Bacteroidia bacterium]|nr:beta galactosidase jelly roll domain-containing protein [Bacteroidia bacterium]